MSLNYFLIWFICLSCIVSLGRLLFFAVNPSRGWIIIYAFILLVTLGSLYVIPNSGGLIGGVLWLVFVVLPSMGLAQMNQLSSEQRYQEAYKIANYVRWLHPADGLIEEPKFLLALSLGQEGKLEQANSLLQSFQVATTELACQAEVLLYSIQGNWQKCLETIQDNLPYKVIFKNKYLTIYYLRALGETGNLNDLIQGVGLCEDRLEKAGDWQTLNLLRLIALAFAGKIDEVREIFDQTLGNYPISVQRFWILTAMMATKNINFLHTELLTLHQRNDWILKNAIDWRLSHTLGDTNSLSYLSHQIIAHIQEQLAEEVLENKILTFKLSRAYITYSLIALNIGFFALAIIKGGSQNLEVLYQLGALVPKAVYSGQWWRLLTANFLHFGWTHLATNMLGLYFLGPFVEANLGKKRYLMLYLVTGIATMLIFSWLGMKTGNGEQTLVGASAAIMGLFGCICAIFVKIYRRGQYDFALRRLRAILLVLGVQFLFDWVTPQVSLLSHLLGLIIGFLLSMRLLK